MCVCRLRGKDAWFLLLLLLSGNVQPNPGPPSSSSQIATPADFKARSGLGFIHLNVRSLLGKLDFVRIWASSTDADVIVLSETWLNTTILASDISLKGYNVYRTDRPNKGGGVAIYVKNKFSVTTLISKSVNYTLITYNYTLITYNYTLITYNYTLITYTCIL